jgi:hypothetical protein
MLQIDASPFDWLSKGSMISLHGAVDDGTGNVTALRFEPAECLDGSFASWKRPSSLTGSPGPLTPMPTPSSSLPSLTGSPLLRS